MKKNRKAATKYYIVLSSGFLVFLPFVFFECVFPGSVNQYSIFFCTWLVLALLGWLYAIKKSVETKEFLAYEKDSEKNTKLFFQKNNTLIKKIIKICFIADIPMTILVIVLNIMHYCYGIREAVVGNYYHMFWIFYNLFLFGFKHLLKGFLR